MFDKVFVSTDSPKIAIIAKKFGAEIPFLRPKNISDEKTKSEIIEVITRKKTDVKNLIDQVQIGIFENNTVKRLSKNDLFSKIKDSIFSENKTTFDSVRLEFEMKDNLLNINSFLRIKKK